MWRIVDRPADLELCVKLNNIVDLLHMSVYE